MRVGHQSFHKSNRPYVGLQQAMAQLSQFVFLVLLFLRQYVDSKYIKLTIVSMEYYKMQTFTTIFFVGWLIFGLIEWILETRSAIIGGGCIQKPKIICITIVKLGNLSFTCSYSVQFFLRIQLNNFIRPCLCTQSPVAAGG